MTRSIDVAVDGHHELVSRSMVIISDSRNGYDKTPRLSHRAGTASRGDRRVHAHDPHLASGGIIDTAHELQKRAACAFFEITAALADKYVPDADRPR